MCREKEREGQPKAIEGEKGRERETERGREEVRETERGGGEELERGKTEGEKTGSEQERKCTKPIKK